MDSPGSKPSTATHTAVPAEGPEPTNLLPHQRENDDPEVAKKLDDYQTRATIYRFNEGYRTELRNKRWGTSLDPHTSDFQAQSGWDHPTMPFGKLYTRPVSRSCRSSLTKPRH